MKKSSNNFFPNSTRVLKVKNDYCILFLYDFSIDNHYDFAIILQIAIKIKLFHNVCTSTKHYSYYYQCSILIFQNLNYLNFRMLEL